MGIIGNPKCGAPCETCDCTDLLGSNCIFYQGPNLVNSGINTNDSLTSALSKIDSGLGAELKVTSSDNCSGFLNDKIVAGPGVSKSIVVQGGCQKLQLAAAMHALTFDDFEEPATSSAQTVFTIASGLNIAFINLDGGQRILRSDWTYVGTTLTLSGAYSAGIDPPQSLIITTYSII